MQKIRGESAELPESQPILHPDFQPSQCNSDVLAGKMLSELQHTRVLLS